MPSRTKFMKVARPAVLPPIPKELIEQFMTRRMTGEKVAAMSFGAIVRATMRQTFIVQLTCNSLDSVKWKTGELWSRRSIRSAACKAAIGFATASVNLSQAPTAGVEKSGASQTQNF